MKAHSQHIQSRFYILPNSWGELLLRGPACCLARPGHWYGWGLQGQGAPSGQLGQLLLAINMGATELGLFHPWG